MARPKVNTMFFWYFCPPLLLLHMALPWRVHNWTSTKTVNGGGQQICEYNSRAGKCVVKKKMNVITLIIMPVTQTHVLTHTYRVVVVVLQLLLILHSYSLSCRCLCTPKFSSALADASSSGSRFSSPICPTKCWIMHATWQSNYIIAWGVICSCICISPPAGWCSARLHSYQVSERQTRWAKHSNDKKKRKLLQQK